jgi:hypothetical protein
LLTVLLARSKGRPAAIGSALAAEPLDCAGLRLVPQVGRLLPIEARRRHGAARGTIRAVASAASSRWSALSSPSF